MSSGYTDCACRDCFEIAVRGEEEVTFCWECTDAGCTEDSECDALNARDLEEEEEQYLHERRVEATRDDALTGDVAPVPTLDRNGEW